MPEEATAHDWEDFWYSPEKFGTWHPEDTKDGDDIVVNMDGGVGGSWEVKCSLDDEDIPCEQLQEPDHTYTGVPAPALFREIFLAA